MGTPELARTSLEALLGGSLWQVVAVVTQPDRPKGRDLHLQPSPVKELAREHNLPVLQPERARDEVFLTQLRSLAPDLITVAAFGQILPPVILDLPRFGCLNVHTSLLPRYRGAAPIQWAILNDEVETGVTIMSMDTGLDTGPIVSQERTQIRSEDNAQTLHDRLARMGASLLVRTLPDYLAGKLKPVPQAPELATHARKIKKQDGQLEWTQAARALWNRVRGLTPWPGGFTFLPATPAPRLLKIWKAQPVEAAGPPGEILRTGAAGIVVGCGSGALRIDELQLEGGRRLRAGAFLAGHKLTPGQRLGEAT